MNKPVQKAERLTIALERLPLQLLHMQRFRQLYYISILAIKNLASIYNNITASINQQKGMSELLSSFSEGATTEASEKVNNDVHEVNNNLPALNNVL